MSESGVSFNKQVEGFFKRSSVYYIKADQSDFLLPVEGNLLKPVGGKAEILFPPRVAFRSMFFF